MGSIYVMGVLGIRVGDYGVNYHVYLRVYGIIIYLGSTG